MSVSRMVFIENGNGNGNGDHYRLARLAREEQPHILRECEFSLNFGAYFAQEAHTEPAPTWDADFCEFSLARVLDLHPKAQTFLFEKLVLQMMADPNRFIELGPCFAGKIFLENITAIFPDIEHTPQFLAHCESEYLNCLRAARSDPEAVLNLGFYSPFVGRTVLQSEEGRQVFREFVSEVLPVRPEIVRWVMRECEGDYTFAFTDPALRNKAAQSVLALLKDGDARSEGSIVPFRVTELVPDLMEVFRLGDMRFSPGYLAPAGALIRRAAEEDRLSDMCNLASLLPRGEHNLKDYHPAARDTLEEIRPAVRVCIMRVFELKTAAPPVSALLAQAARIFLTDEDRSAPEFRKKLRRWIADLARSKTADVTHLKFLTSLVPEEARDDFLTTRLEYRINKRFDHAVACANMMVDSLRKLARQPEKEIDDTGHETFLDVGRSYRHWQSLKMAGEFFGFYTGDLLPFPRKLINVAKGYSPLNDVLHPSNVTSGVRFDYMSLTPLCWRASVETAERLYAEDKLASARIMAERAHDMMLHVESLERYKETAGELLELRALLCDNPSRTQHLFRRALIYRLQMFGFDSPSWAESLAEYGDFLMRRYGPLRGENTVALAATIRRFAALKRAAPNNGFEESAERIVREAVNLYPSSEIDIPETWFVGVLDLDRRFSS